MLLTRNRILSLLDVDIQTGRLVWIHHDQRPDLIGTEAGSINEGYRRVRIDTYELYACQIVWFIAKGDWPKHTLDHIDTVKLNDGIDNLRESSKAQNAANAKINVRNTSGFKGVSKSGNKWRADIRVDGTSKNLGRYNTPEEAHAVWYKAACAVWGEEFVRAA